MDHNSLQGWNEDWQKGSEIGNFDTEGPTFSVIYKKSECTSATGRFVKTITVSSDHKKKASKVTVEVILTDRGAGRESLQRPITLRFNETAWQKTPYSITEDVANSIASELTSSLVTRAKSCLDGLL
jgi:hypothetical protein